MTLAIERIGAHLGAAVSGVDFKRPVSDTMANRLRAALYEYQVLIFRDQHLDAEQHLAAAKIFGRPAPSEPAGFLGVTDPIQTFVRDASRGESADRWHTDTPFMEDPPITGILMPLRIPSAGGDTAWVSLYAIYEALSPQLRNLCEGLFGEHSIRTIRGLMRTRAKLSPEQMLALDDAFPDRLHPLVQRHWVSGKPLIYDGGEWMERIVGVPPEEAAMLRTFLRQQIEKVNYQFRWRWSPGELAVWDERSTNHIGMSDHYAIDPNRTMRSIFAYRTAYSAPIPG